MMLQVAKRIANIRFDPSNEADQEYPLRLKEDSYMTFQEITEIIAAGLGSIGFSMMFQLRGKKLILIGCGGALSWFIFLL